MGFFKDLKNVKQQAEAMTPPEYRGMGGSMRLARDGMAQMSAAMGDMAAEAQRAQRLAQSGIAGSATVAALRDTGATVNDNPVVELDLQVTLPGEAPYAATCRQTINRLFIANFQPGATVPVKVDPADRTQLMVA